MLLKSFRTSHVQKRLGMHAKRARHSIAEAASTYASLCAIAHLHKLYKRPIVASSSPGPRR